MDNQDQYNSTSSDSNDQTSTGHIDGLGTPPAADDQPSNDSASSSSNDLQTIKDQALSQLTPLVKNLDQDPEERFRTIMMMIQVSDNQDLIKDAYAAASSITDENLKAQALLDVVNEINYFSQTAN
jgi:hypothetical protein